MRKLVAVLLASSLVSAAGMLAAQQRNAVPPPWAYGFTTPPPPVAPAPAAAPAAPATPAPPNPTPHQIAGSRFSFTSAQIGNGYGPADWFPEDHPAMPDIVSQGRREAQIFACGLCHYPNGKGRPENAPVSGLPYEYFVQTMMDFRNDQRKSADPRKANTNRMIAFAKAMTEDEIKAAAKYYSSMKWTPWIKVVETTTVPKTRTSVGMFLPLEGTEAGTEPLGMRIIEVPEDADQTEVKRNPRSGFIAYAPPGSVRKGQALVKAGQCTTCHGAELEGLGPVPGIAGRSPSYVMRQLFDMQQGDRKGLWTELMKPVVANLSEEDMLNVAAYIASVQVGVR
jgi:cytochrome c553